MLRAQSWAHQMCCGTGDLWRDCCLEKAGLSLKQLGVAMLSNFFRKTHAWCLVPFCNPGMPFLGISTKSKNKHPSIYTCCNSRHTTHTSVSCFIRIALMQHNHYIIFNILDWNNHTIFIHLGYHGALCGCLLALGTQIQGATGWRRTVQGPCPSLSVKDANVSGPCIRNWSFTTAPYVLSLKYLQKSRSVWLYVFVWHVALTITRVIISPDLQTLHWFLQKSESPPDFSFMFSVLKPISYK